MLYCLVHQQNEDKDGNRDDEVVEEEFEKHKILERSLINDFLHRVCLYSSL